MMFPLEFAAFAKLVDARHARLRDYLARMQARLLTAERWTGAAPTPSMPRARMTPRLLRPHAEANGGHAGSFEELRAGTEPADGGEAKNVARMKATVAGAGDTWTWTAIEADTKLLISWLVWRPRQ